MTEWRDASKDAPVAVEPVAPDEEPQETPPVTPEGEAEAEEEGEQETEAAEQQEPQAQALSEKDVEKRIEKLSRERERHEKRLQEILESDVSMLVACPLCTPITPGYVMTTPDVPERFPAVRAFIGDAEPRDLRADSKATRCETCDGWGFVDTGSRVQGQSELPCVDCGGKGWTGERVPAGQPPAYVPPTPLGANGPPTTEVAPPDPPEVADLKAKGYAVIKLAQPATGT